jgi:excisionase family DNA binding protein
MQNPLSVSAAAKELGMSGPGIIHAIKSGHLIATRQGPYYRIEAAALEEYRTNRPLRGQGYKGDATDTMSVTEAAIACGVTRTGILLAIRKGAIEAKRVGQVFRVDPSTLERYKQSRPRRGRRSQTPQSHDDALLRLAQLPPQSLGLPRWTLDFLARQLAQRDNIQMTTGRISDVLRTSGLRDKVLTSHRGRRAKPL